MQFVLAVLMFSFFGCGKDSLMSPQTNQDDNNAPAGKLVVTKEKAGGRREIRPVKAKPVISLVWPRKDAVSMQGGEGASNVGIVYSIDDTSGLGDYTVLMELRKDEHHVGNILFGPAGHFLWKGEWVSFSWGVGTYNHEGSDGLAYLTGADYGSGYKLRVYLLKKESYQWPFFNEPSKNSVVSFDETGPFSIVPVDPKLFVIKSLSQTLPQIITTPGSKNIPAAFFDFVVGGQEDIFLESLGLKFYGDITAIDKIKIWWGDDLIWEGFITPSDPYYISCILNRGIWINNSWGERKGKLLRVTVDINGQYLPVEGSRHTISVDFDYDHPYSTGGVSEESATIIYSDSSAEWKYTAVPPTVIVVR